MLWAQVKVLLPSFLGQWAFLVCLFFCAWYGWTRTFRQYVFKWQGPVLAATVFSFYLSMTTLFNLYQNGALYAFQQNVQSLQQASQAAAPGGAKLDPATQMKADFLKNLEWLIQNPDKVTAENKKKLFNDFGKLFPKGKEDRETYLKAVGEIYQCQRYFWEDALTSYKSKQSIVSDARKECESAKGDFFNRPKLIPDDVVKGNGETIAALAAHKRVPASDGKTVEVTESMLRDALENQIKASQTLRTIFD